MVRESLWFAIVFFMDLSLKNFVSQSLKYAIYICVESFLIQICQIWHFEVWDIIEYLNDKFNIHDKWIIWILGIFFIHVINFD